MKRETTDYEVSKSAVWNLGDVAESSRWKPSVTSRLAQYLYSEKEHLDSNSNQTNVMIISRNILYITTIVTQNIT